MGQNEILWKESEEKRWKVIKQLESHNESEYK